MNNCKLCNGTGMYKEITYTTENPKTRYCVCLDNRQMFIKCLELNYEKLFKFDPDYSYSAVKTTPNELAVKMTDSLIAGTANKDGKAIKAACKEFKIKHTYKEIQAFLKAS